MLNIISKNVAKFEVSIFKGLAIKIKKVLKLNYFYKTCCNSASTLPN